jgi:MFS family permease
MSIHRPILSAAWRLATRRKKLWVFGFFALLVFIGGEYQIINQSLNSGWGANIYERLLTSSSLPPELWTALLGALSVDWRTSLAVIILILLVTGLLFGVLWLAVKSQIALIRWAKKDHMGQGDEEISLWEAFTVKDGRFGRVLAVGVLVEIIIFATGVFLSLPLIYLYFKNSLWAVAAYSLFFLILIPLAVSFSLIAKYAMAEIVLKKKGFTASVISAIELFKKNWLVSLEMALILFFINFSVSFIILFLLTFVAFPIMLTLMIFDLALPLALLILTCFLLIVSIASFLMTFQTTAWTNLYLKIKEHGAPAKIERIFEKGKSPKKTQAAKAPAKTTKKLVSKRPRTTTAKKTTPKKKS